MLPAGVAGEVEAAVGHERRPSGRWPGGRRRAGRPRARRRPRGRGDPGRRRAAPRPSASGRCCPCRAPGRRCRILRTRRSPSSLPFVPLDPRTPVLVGVGQLSHRVDQGADAPRTGRPHGRGRPRAEADAGATGVLAGLDSIRVVSILSWRYPDPGRARGRAGRGDRRPHHLHHGRRPDAPDPGAPGRRGHPGRPGRRRAGRRGRGLAHRPGRPPGRRDAGLGRPGAAPSPTSWSAPTST